MFSYICFGASLSVLVGLAALSAIYIKQTRARYARLMVLRAGGTKEQAQAAYDEGVK